MKNTVAMLLAGVLLAGTAIAHERDHAFSSYPPGLARLHDGCVPPGQLRRDVRVDEFEARDVRARHDLALRDARIRHDAALRAAAVRHRAALDRAAVRHHELLVAARRRHEQQLALRR